MDNLCKSPIFFRRGGFTGSILFRLNERFTRQHIAHFPQLAVFSFDHIGLLVNAHGRYEHKELVLIDSFIKTHLPHSPAGVALDIGANIGNHSVNFSKDFARTYSFEPNPITFDVLQVNAKHVALGKVIPLNFGLSDREGRLAFEVDNQNIGRSRIVSDSVTGGNLSSIHQIDVKTADSLDVLADERILMIKIDVEGHELNALKGAEGLIKKNKPAIFFEQSSDDFRDDSSPVVDYLSSLGYEFYVLQGRFFSSDNFALRLCSLVLRSFFGEQMKLVKTKAFKKRSYNLILAFHSVAKP